MESRDRRMQYLKQHCQDIIEEWEDHKMSMSKFGSAFFGKGLLNDSKTFLKSIAKSTVSGGAVATAAATAKIGTAVLASTAGLAIGVIFHGISTGTKLYQRQSKSPYRYLSRIQKAGGILMVGK